VWVLKHIDAAKYLRSISYPQVKTVYLQSRFAGLSSAFFDIEFRVLTDAVDTSSLCFYAIGQIVCVDAQTKKQTSLTSHVSQVIMASPYKRLTSSKL